NAAVLAVTGPVAGDTVVTLARARFGRWTKRRIVPATFLPPTPATETRVVVVDRPGAPDAIVRAGFWTDGRSAAGSALVKAVAARLGGDLSTRLGGSGVAASFELRTLQS